MTTITISIPDEQVQKLNEIAARLSTHPEELARAGIEDFLSRPEEDFHRALEHVLVKNAELYRRLA
jgi:antitoxin FitA